MSVVDLDVALDNGLEVSVVSKKVLQSLFSNRNPSLVVGIFVSQIDDLQKSGIGEKLCRFGEVNHANVISGFQQKVQTQARRVGDNLHLNFGKLPSTLERVNAGFNFSLGVRLANFLHDQW